MQPVIKRHDCSTLGHGKTRSIKGLHQASGGGSRTLVKRLALRSSPDRLNERERTQRIKGFGFSVFTSDSRDEVSHAAALVIPKREGVSAARSSPPPEEIRLDPRSIRQTAGDMFGYPPNTAP